MPSSLVFPPPTSTASDDNDIDKTAEADDEVETVGVADESDEDETGRRIVSNGGDRDIWDEQGEGCEDCDSCDAFNAVNPVGAVDGSGWRDTSDGFVCC